MISVKNLYYCPVKSVSFSKSNELFIIKNIGIKNDRIFVFTKNLDAKKTQSLLTNPNQRKLNNFLTLKNTPELNEFNFEYIDNKLIFKNKNEPILIINPSKKIDINKICNKIEMLIFNKQNINLLSDFKNPFFDTMPNNSISLINISSVNDFASKINKKIEYERFRSNIYIKGLDPWVERSWINKIIKINNVSFLITNNIPRCSATNLQPNTSNVTMNLPLELKKIYNHIDMGIYLLPLNDGSIKIDDQLNLND